MDFYVVLESNTGMEYSDHLSLDEYQRLEGRLLYDWIVRISSFVKSVRVKVGLPVALLIPSFLMRQFI